MYDSELKAELPVQSTESALGEGGRGEMIPGTQIGACNK